MDNDEPLVNLETKCPKIIFRLERGGRPFVRKTVADKISQALTYLPEGMTFIIDSAWRPVDQQKRLYLGLYKSYQKEHPDWPKATLQEKTEIFVAPYKGRHTSGHMAGAAVDIVLAKNGRQVPLRSGKLSSDENAQSNQTKLSEYIMRNRRTMSDALSRAGLINYQPEYWHWCYGDQIWADALKQKPFYQKIDALAK